jgi:hypothetical protein
LPDTIVGDECSHIKAIVRAFFHAHTTRVGVDIVQNGIVRHVSTSIVQAADITIIVHRIDYNSCITPVGCINTDACIHDECQDEKQQTTSVGTPALVDRTVPVGWSLEFLLSFFVEAVVILVIFFILC